MRAISPQPLNLEAFLRLPETRPASEYINGEVIQKPMPKGKHSRLQLIDLELTVDQVFAWLKMVDRS